MFVVGRSSYPPSAGIKAELPIWWDINLEEILQIPLYKGR